MLLCSSNGFLLIHSYFFAWFYWWLFVREDLVGLIVLPLPCKRGRTPWFEKRPGPVDPVLGKTGIYTWGHLLVYLHLTSNYFILHTNCISFINLIYHESDFVFILIKFKKKEGLKRLRWHPVICYYLFIKIISFLIIYFYVVSEQVQLFSGTIFL